MKTTQKPRSATRKTRSRTTVPKKARSVKSTLGKLAERASYALNKLAKKF